MSNQLRNAQESFPAFKERWLVAMSADAKMRAAVPTMVMLASYLNSRSRLAYPRQKKLAARLGCSVDTVQRHISLAIELGYLCRSSQKTSGVLLNFYAPNFPAEIETEA